MQARRTFDGTRNSTTAVTEGLKPAKTQLGRARSTVPPYFSGYPLRPGITFTYLGVAGQRPRAGADAGRQARRPTSFAAGEIMAGSILGRGYLAGFGMTIGTVFGRIAGQEAAKHALS